MSKKKYGTIDIEGWKIEANVTNDGHVNVYVLSLDGSPALLDGVGDVASGGIWTRFLSQHTQDAEDHTTPDRFKVVEYSNGFAVVDLVTGLEHWLSDGVDVLFDEDDNPLSPGTPGFCEAWSEDLNSEPWVTMDAYWHLLFNASGYEYPSLHLRWQVILEDGRGVSATGTGEDVRWDAGSFVATAAGAIQFCRMPEVVQKAIAEVVYE